MEDAAPMKVTVNMKPEIRALVAEGSKADSRSISSLIEILVREHVPKIIELRKSLTKEEKIN